MNGLIGRKLGMTQIYSDSGEAIPVTVIAAGPCAVVQVKTAPNGGSVQLGYGQRKEKHASKAQGGHAKSAGLETIPEVLSEVQRVLRACGRFVTASMATVCPGEHDSLLERTYKWMHRHFPHIVDCQPIEADRLVRDAGFTITTSTRVSMWTMPVAVIAAQ